MSSKNSTGRGIAGVFMLFALTIFLCPTGCPAHRVKQNPIEDISGFWYIIATSAANGESYYQCTTLNITRLETSLKFTFEGISIPSGKSKTYPGMIRPGKGRYATWWIEYENEHLHGSFKYVVNKKGDNVVMTFTDIDSHGHSLRKSGVILSQTKTLEPEKLSELKELFHPHIASHDIYGIKQVGCES